MEVIGKVIDTFSAKKGQNGLPRPKVEKLNLIEGFGIEFDKFANKDIKKAVMIVGNYSYQLAKEQGINLINGSLGENILLSFNPHDYNIGTQLKIGKAIIEITEYCTICNHLSVFDDDLPLIVQDCRGLYCKITKGGEVEKGLPVEVVEIKQHKVAF